MTALAEPFDMSLPAVSKHLKVLERARLIERSSRAQWRPCRLAPEPLKSVAEWVDHYREFWEERFDRLDDDLGDVQARADANPIVVQRPQHESTTQESNHDGI